MIYVDIFSDDKVKLSLAQEVIVESTIMIVCGIVLATRIYCSWDNR